MRSIRKIDLNQYESEIVRNIMAAILYEYGVDVKGAKKSGDKKRPKLSIVKTAAEASDDSGSELEQEISAVEEERHIKPQPQRRRLPPAYEQKPTLYAVERKPAQVTIEELLKYYKHEGVVGEEKNCVLQTLCAVDGLSFGLEGNSGSGKTFLVDALINLLPKEEVYELGLSSEQAAFNDSKNINKRRFIYIPEIQKAMNNTRNKASSIIELIKNLTEGKDASRIVTVGRGEIAKYKIKAGITIIYTLALENCFKKDNETSRRFIRLMTDTSPEHIGEVMNYKAEERCSIKNSKCLSREDIERIRQHVKNCIEMPRPSYFDPFSMALNEYLPATPKTIGFVDHYYGLLNASAKFHHKNRIFTGDALVLDIEDHYLVHTLYYNEFCKSLSELNRGSFCGEASQAVQNKMAEMDWKKFFATGLMKMNEQLPSFVEMWAAKQLKGNCLHIYDILSGGFKDIEIGGANV